MRSTRADVRNPLLQLESARRLGEWLMPSTARMLAMFLRELADDARGRAGECWRKHKAPMALYWKVVAVYARHLSQICRAIARQAAAETTPAPTQQERVLAGAICNELVGPCYSSVQRDKVAALLAEFSR